MDIKRYSVFRLQLVYVSMHQKDTSVSSQDNCRSVAVEAGDMKEDYSVLMQWIM